MHPVIELKNITKNYHTELGEQTVLKRVHFELFHGERVAIMGSSGSGKSTLMNILGLLDRPTSGHYLLHGKEVANLPEDERAGVRNKTIGFVFQSFFLLPRLNLLQNVGLPLHYRGYSEAEIMPHALEMLKKVGLGDHVHARPNQLSGGQQQRAAIARALIGNPEVLLADEPTGSLDTKTGQIIMDLFIHLNEKEHVTTIIVTHDPRIADQCKRVVHIADGRIVDQDSGHPDHHHHNDHGQEKS